MSSPGNSTDAVDFDAAAADGEPDRPASGFGCSLADRIDYVRPDDWDSLAAGASVFLSRRYLQLNEEHGPRELGHRYAVVYRGRRPVAVVACQSLNINASQLVNLSDSGAAASGDGLKRSVRSLGQKALGTLHRRVLCCGNLLSWGPHGWAIAAGEDAASVWNGIAEALYRIRRADKRAGPVDYLMVKDVCETPFPGGDALREAGYDSLETEPEMALELRSAWRNFDDYLESLNTKYRKAMLGVREAVTKAGCVVDRLSDVASQGDVLHRLYDQVTARAETRLIHQPADYLPGLADRLGPDQFRVTVVRRDDEIVGFVSTLRDGEAAIGYFLGLDYATNAETPVYLRLLQAVVEDAVAMGARRVSFGRTALEPKARLGARPISTQVWIRHRVPVLNSLVRRLLKVVPHDEAPDRSPFKAES